MQGLSKAIRGLAPNAGHKNCARHIYAKWKKIHRGQEFKSIFWKVVNATHVQAFNERMKKLKEISSFAYEDFLKQDLKVFCKAFINT